MASASVSSASTAPTKRQLVAFVWFYPLLLSVIAMGLAAFMSLWLLFVPFIAIGVGGGIVGHLVARKELFDHVQE